MSSVNYPNPKLDQTVQIFNNFYNLGFAVNGEEYDLVYSYFKSVFKDDLAAKNFTLNVFEIADKTGKNALTLLSELQGQDQIQISSTLAYYLNNQRSNATLLGVSSVLTPNYYAARNALP